ncbi:hypothetical protein AX17_003568 [Amanita inopinata Kibby_2008]|nr:hypothetical protein AX17_003568 [Amanita inopinata Kibby_2008]
MNNGAQDGEAGQAENRQQRPRSSFSSFLFLCLILFLLTSHNSDEFLARQHYQDALQVLSYQLSNYTAWLNGTATNLSIPDREPILGTLLEAFQVQGRELDPDQESYFPNITGFIHGNLEYHNISLPALSTSTGLPERSLLESYMASASVAEMEGKLGEWNWSTSDKVAFSVIEKPATTMQKNVSLSKEMALIHGRVELKDKNNNNELRLEFEGVHVIPDGSMYGFAAPNGQPIDIRQLPAIVPAALKNETAMVIEPELVARIQKLENLIDAGVVDSDSSQDDSPKATCPFTLYAQIRPVAIPVTLMQDLEVEVQRPTGATTVKAPKLSIDGILISRDCGILYRIVDTEGLRSQSFFRKVTTYAGTAMLLYLVMVILFTRQAKRSRTPSGISRVSRWTFLAQATIDSVSFAGHITFAILAEGRPSLSLTAPAFLACILFIYEAQFSVLVYQIQLPENVTATHPPAASTTGSPAPLSEAPSATDELTRANAESVAASNANSQPTVPVQVLPVHATQATNTAVSRSFLSFLIHHIRTDPQARLWLMLFVFLTVIVRVILSPLLSLLFVTITYSSIWLPQVVRSALRGRTSGLAKEYVIGTTVCRLYYILYFLTCPNNVLEIKPRPWVYLLVLFVFLQAVVVMLQEWLGAAFFLPRRYAMSHGYNYHPSMPLPDTESPEQSLGDCSICMDRIVVETHMSPRQSQSSDEKSPWDDHMPGTGNDVRRKASTGASVLLNAMHRSVGNASSRKVYSLAPCHHLFHTECLERWLAIKNICPQCRRPLPPL